MKTINFENENAVKNVTILPLGRQFIAKGDTYEELYINKVEITPTIVNYYNQSDELVLTEENGQTYKSYIDVQHFKDNDSVARTDLTYCNTIVNTRIEGNKLRFHLTEDGYLACDVYLFIEGNVEQATVCPNKITYQCGIFTSEFPVDVYPSREDYIAWNATTFRKEDGTEEVVGGYAREIILTEDQKKLVAKFNALYKKMRDAGIEFVYDTNNETIYCYNGKKYHFGYDCEFGGESMYDLFGQVTEQLDMYAAYYSSDCYSEYGFDKSK